MGGYSPLYISKPETGLVQSRQEFLLPNDAYPILENAYVWRERLKRKKGCELLGRLRRVLTAQALGVLDGGGAISANIITVLSLEAGATFEPGTLIISDTINTYTDNGVGILVGVPGGSGTINYATGAFTITGGLGGAALTASFNYYPNLPVMGLRSEELNNINKEKLIAFDTKYAYEFINGWTEFLSNTALTWTGTDSDFFWSTNYWVGDLNRKIFWVNNFVDPIRYTNGTAATNWVNFNPQLNVAGDLLTNALMILPFRGRMLALNTIENGTQYYQRVRWAAIGNPFTIVSPIVTVVSANAWRDDIRGKGGFLDIPTSEAIVTCGFVRDNLVIYCERSTWQLRYTGRSIAPFQIERVNSELGAESTFSGVQFDTSLVGIGDKGVVECDSYQSNRIDIKIPDLVFQFNNDAQGQSRVHGIRDFLQRLAYWIYPYVPGDGVSVTYPNRRLVYNYENDSWAIFKDSFTCLGTYQPQTSRRWSDYTMVDRDEWKLQDFQWIDRPSLLPTIVAGNQQGYVEFISYSTLDGGLNSNDVTLYIKGITGNTTTATSLNVPSHNLETGYIIEILAIPTGTPFATSLNGKVFMVVVTGVNDFTLYTYNATTQQFTDPQLDAPATYIGGGQISIRDNFRIVSKKFNSLEDGQNTQLGFIDILMDSTEQGAISLNVYLDYNTSNPINQQPENIQPDTFFNQVVPTTTPNSTSLEGSKYWQRVFCPVRGAFITIEWTLSNLQMIGVEQTSDVQIDAQILYMRKAGRQLPIGV